jgi:hypothetical protein
VAKSAEPPNAKITALVCSGRNRPYESQGTPKLSSGQMSWAAMMAPTSMPTMPQTIVMTVNCRTTLSLYVVITPDEVAAVEEFMGDHACCQDAKILFAWCARKNTRDYARTVARVGSTTDAV